MFAVLLSSLGQHVLRAAASVVVLALVIQLIQKLKSHKHAHDQKTHCDPIAVQQQTTHHVSVWNCNNEVHVSGARGTVHVMGEGSQMVAGGLSEQAAQALHNIKSVVEVAVLHQSPKGASSPLSFADVDEALRPDGRDYLRQCRVVMPIKNATPAAVAEVERVFATFLTGALSTPVCAFETTDSLPLGVLVEIDCVAKLPNASPMRRISPLLAGPALPVTV